MNKIKSILLISIFVFPIAACQKIAARQVHFTQGNVISDKALAKIHRGMTRGEVAQVMGSAVYDNTFNASDWVYVHFIRDGLTTHTERVVIQFTRDRVASVKHDRTDGAYVYSRAKTN